MVCAEPRRLPVAIFLMKRGTSMWVGQAAVHGASKQKRQRLASTTADCESKAGWRSGKRSRLPRDHRALPHGSRRVHGGQALIEQLDELVHVGRPMFIGGVMRITLP